MFTPLVGFLLALPLIYSTILSYFVTSRRRTFPGPRADPIIGHARIFPLEYPWKTFSEWGRKFGDIIYIHVLNRRMIVLNSFEDARELLEKRSAIYSDRPRFVLFQEMMGWDATLAFLRYGERLKKQRKMMHKHWNVQNVVGFQETQYTETHNLLLRLLHTPDEFTKHIERAIAGGIMMAAYGHKIQSEDDPYLYLADFATQMTVEAGIPGGTLVDFFPILNYIPIWMPGAGFKRHAIKARKAIEEMFETPFEMVKSQRTKGIVKPSFLTHLFEDYENEDIADENHEEDMKALSATLYGAAVETTISSLLTFVLAMTLNPSIARKAQKEIDDVVGADRLPRFQDREKLKYTECIMKEVYRWNPPLPLGLPHSTTKRDIYKGKHIETGSMIIPNIWGMMKDPIMFPDPEVFNPDRFSSINNQETDTNGNPNKLHHFDPATVVFGFGRRVCPGRFYADNGIWLIVVSLLACFEILPVQNQNGQDILPSAEFTTGSTSQPKAFKCQIKLRHRKYEHLIRTQLAGQAAT